MNKWMYAYLAIGLLLFAAPAGALVPDNITIRTDRVWVTAGSPEPATLTVQVLNSTSGNTSFEGVAVNFAVDNTYGRISPTHVATDANGTATAVFTPTTTSGTAMITATATYTVGEETVSLTGSVDQRVDHAAPAAVAGLSYESEVTVGETTEIIVQMVDCYGNIVDNQNATENVEFMVGSPAGGATFNDVADKISVPVGLTGDATVTLRVDTVAGENIVLVTFPGNIGSRYLTINGHADALPSSIYQSVSPRVEDPNPDYYPEVPLGQQFAITYSLYDGYGNVAGDRRIQINIRPISGSLSPEEQIVTTNCMGKAQIVYGSDISGRTGVVEIVATAVDNSSVSCAQKVGFYSTTPTGMLLTAVPQTIASRDVKDDIVSHVKAKVMDSKGNPVRNECVSFKIVSVESGTFLMTHGPEISNSTHTYSEIGQTLVATTDEDGFATIDFHPGYFTRNKSDSRYSDIASGSTTIEAVWKDKQGSTTISFRNYPYVSINVSVEPQVVAVNDSVNVTIQLIGDGWALQSRPIDVVLCTDRSGSMLQNTTTASNYDDDDFKWVQQESVDDRMVHAMRAAKVFVSQMESYKDKIGLVSFGNSGYTDLDKYSYYDGEWYAYQYKYWAGNDYKWSISHNKLKWRSDSGDDDDYISAHYKNPKNYAGPATRDLELTSSYGNVNTTIDNWLPCGGTPMREGLYQSVQMILDNRSEKANTVEAIVLLTDGMWSTNQNPVSGKDLGGKVGTGSVIDYANSEGIKIFTIALGNEPSHDELRSYADQTGGKFYNVTAGDDLTQVYEGIATKLQEAAGVNTTMDLVFNNVMINSTPTSNVFRYEPLAGVSTKEAKYWTDNKALIGEPGEWPKIHDQSSDWSDETLSFDVGDIYLDQTWETTFRLKVLKEGNIDIFGDGSKIRFNGTQGETELGLPHTFITASLGLNESEIITSDIWLDSLTVPMPAPGILVPSWDLIYTGNWSVVQEIMYQFSPDNVWWDGAWHVGATQRLPADTDINGTYSARLDLGGQEGWYQIRVLAREEIPEGVSDEVTCVDTIQVEMMDRAYIRIG